MAKIYQVALAVLLPFSFAAAQQTLTLKDGTQFQGRLVRGTPDLITFVEQGGVRHNFTPREIESIYFGGRRGEYSGNNNGYSDRDRDQRYTGNQPPPPPAPGYNANGAYNNNQQYPPPAQPGNYNNQQPAYGQQGSAYATLPAGTQLQVRTSEAIRSSGANSGRTFASTVDQDVVDARGNVVIPRGSNALLVVRDIGRSQVALDLQSVNVNGQRYAMNTEDVTQTANGKRGVGANKRTGEYVGGGAVLGTLLGAIAGGGRGAAIGALAGAAAGAGTQVLTKGSEIQVPSETLLTFNLDQPVYLYQ